MKKKIAIIGGSYLQLPAVLKARELGYEVHCFAWRDGAVCEQCADYFYPISIIEKKKYWMSVSASESMELLPLLVMWLFLLLTI